MTARFLKNAGVVLGSLAMTFLCLEGVMRLLPVHSSLQAVPVNARQPIARFRRDQSFTASVGWNFSIVNRGRVNNAGFVNDQGYERTGSRPLLGVVGDSFVEALIVPYSETVHGRLAKAVEGRGRVYSFGMSRSALSQYLVYARHAREVFGADSLVFVVVANDFDESLERYNTAPWEGRIHHYREEKDGELRLVLKDYEPSALKRVLRSSALLRYAYLNAHLHEAAKKIIGWLKGRKAEVYVANTAAKADAERVSLSRRAVDAFFRDLPAYSGLPPEQILFVVDGIRPSLYSAEDRRRDRQSFAGVLREYFLERAKALRYETVDLEPLFVRLHEASGTRFEFPTDNHWNGAGHGVAAGEVLKSRVFARTFGLP